MGFEDELSDRLQEAAADLTFRTTPLSDIHNRAEVRQKRRQLVTRTGSALSLLAVVAVVGLLIVQRSSDNQTIGTAGGTLAGDDLGGPSNDLEEPDGLAGAIDTAADDADNSESLAEPIVVGAHGPIIPLILEPSGVESWQQVLPPTQVALPEDGSADDTSSNNEALTPVATQYVFTGGTTVARVGSDLYVDNGKGWQRLSTPEELDVMAVDAQDDARLVVAGLVTADECDSYMAVATLENDHWSIRRVPSDLPPGTRPEPLAAEVRTAGAITVLSTAERIRFDPLCLIRYLAASGSGSASDSASDVSGTDAEGTDVASTDVASTGGSETRSDGAISGDVIVKAWDWGGPDSTVITELSLADIVEARLIDFGIHVVTSTGKEFLLHEGSLVELRPFDKQYLALLASLRVSDEWMHPLASEVDPEAEAMLFSAWVVRVSQSSPANTGSDNSTPSSVWQIKNLQFVPWSEGTSSVPVVPTLGVIDGEVVTTFLGQVVSLQSGLSENDPRSPNGAGETLEPTSEDNEDPTSGGTANMASHFYAARDGSVTTMDLGVIPSQGTRRTFRYLDALRKNGQEAAVVIENNETTVSVGDQMWKLSDLSGFDSGWARLGEVGDELRLITLVNGQQRLYQLTSSG